MHMWQSRRDPVAQGPSFEENQGGQGDQGNQGEACRVSPSRDGCIVVVGGVTRWAQVTLHSLGVWVRGSALQVQPVPRAASPPPDSSENLVVTTSAPRTQTRLGPGWIPGRAPSFGAFQFTLRDLYFHPP